MTDRVPGAPGQYSAVIQPEELEKLQNGENFIITLTRDDQPITPGTPYNKASVLPDELAAAICPGVEDPAPKDALQALYEGKAPSGCGYGDKMLWLNFDEASWKATGTFQQDVEALFESMPQGTCRKVQFIDEEGLSNQKFVGELWKYTGSYGVLTAVNYSGCKAVKTFYGDVWGPWEWENPPMVPGVLYRTTKRYNGQIVYAYCQSIGTLPANTGSTPKKITLGVGDGTVYPKKYTSINTVVRGASREYMGNLYVPKEGGNAIYRINIEGTKTLEVYTYTDMSAYTADVFVEFTL